MEQLPRADKLKQVGRENRAMICAVSGWRAVPYREKPEDETKYYCLQCHKWVKNGVGHTLIDHEIGMAIMGPRTKAKGK